MHFILSNASFIVMALTILACGVITEGVLRMVLTSLQDPKGLTATPLLMRAVLVAILLTGASWVQTVQPKVEVIRPNLKREPEKRLEIVPANEPSLQDKADKLLKDSNEATESRKEAFKTL